jgi:hypothetical protein
MRTQSRVGLPDQTAKHAEQPSAQASVGAESIPKPSAADTVSAAQELRDYLTSLKRLKFQVKRVVRLLEQVKDAGTATTEAPRLMELLKELEPAMQDASARLVPVLASPVAKQQLDRMLLQKNATDTEFARRALAEAELDDKPEIVGDDLFRQMIRLAADPQTNPIHPAVRELRDLLLGGKAPLVPPTARTSLIKQLGPTGTVLQNPKRR